MNPSCSCIDSDVSSSSDDGVCCSIFNFTKKDLIKSGFYCTKLFDNIVCCGCGWQSGDVKLSIRHVNFLHKLQNPTCPLSKNISGALSEYCKYKKSVNDTEDLMLETFSRWPKMYPNILELVKAGFYYTGSGDSVACISCGVVLEKWTPDDKPIEEHRKSSPFCEFLKL